MNRRRQLGGLCAPLLRLALFIAAAHALWLAQAWQPAFGDTWIAATGASYHFDRGNDHNERNWGLGVERGLTGELRAVAGFYRNSLYRESVYAGANWLPLSAGPVRFGALAGIVNGYNARDGRFVPIAVPLAAIEGRRFGLNLLYLPRYKDDTGVVGLQIKIRID